MFFLFIFLKKMIFLIFIFFYFTWNHSIIIIIIFLLIIFEYMKKKIFQFHWKPYINTFITHGFHHHVDEWMNEWIKLSKYSGSSNSGSFIVYEWIDFFLIDAKNGILIFHPLFHHHHNHHTYTPCLFYILLLLLLFDIVCMCVNL